MFFVLLAVVSAAGWFALQKWQQDARAEIGAIKERIAEVSADRAALAKVLKDATPTARARGGLDGQLLRVLSDETVNALAQKYLGEDFSTRAREERPELEKLSRKMVGAMRQEKTSSDKVKAELKKIQTKIGDLERKKSHLTKIKMALAPSRRERIPEEIAKFDDQISTLREKERELQPKQKAQASGKGETAAEQASREFQSKCEAIERDTTARLSAVLEGVELRLLSKLESCKKGVPEWLMKLGLGK